MDKFDKSKYEVRVTNNIKLSEEFRNRGNQLYAAGNYFAAIVHYNRSMLMARGNQLVNSLCYANRAAVYLNLNYFEHCLHNLDLAEPNYPPEKIHKLHERRQKCLEMMKSNVDEGLKAFKHEFKLSYEPNPKLPFFIDALELHEDEKYGKHLITTRDLKAGDVIAVMDEPWKMSALSKFQNHMMGCYTCADANNGDLIPGRCDEEEKCEGKLIMK